MKAIKVQEQNNKLVLVSAIRFKELDPIVKFTKRESAEWNPYDFNQQEINQNQEYYQRLTESERVKQIETFIEETILEQLRDKQFISTIFPSSMILAFEIDSFIQNNEIFEFDLPHNDFDCLIVDGQHRFAAMQNVIKNHRKRKTDLSDSIIETINNYMFNCTVLINFDLWEQAQVFANVNFNQKKVNKSLYYDIFGSTPISERIDKRSSLYLSHSLAQFLNTSTKSPLKDFIKMLGTGKGYFSQAFLVEAILEHFKPKGTWAYIDEDYKEMGNKHQILPKILVAYFNAIKILFKEYWPVEGNKYESILCKTTGMGALIKLLGFIHRQLSIGSYIGVKDPINFEEISTLELQKVFEEILKPLNKLGDELFGKKSIYAGAGSAGLQSKLYTRLGQELGLFKK